MDDPVYMNILRKFLESRDSEYSLHMIGELDHMISVMSGELVLT